MGENLVSIKNLKYQNAQFIMNIPELIFKDHCVNVIIGPSGSGKTTLFNLMIGLLQAQGWSFYVDNENLAQLPIEKRQLGVVFQNYELFPHLTAAENILLILKSRHNYSSESLAQLEIYKKQLNLDKCWSTRAENLSGGEKQRVSLLRAVMSKPRLLLLDEPFSALDEANRAESREIVKKFVSDLKMTTLLITHDHKDVEVFGDHVIRMSHGHIV